MVIDGLPPLSVAQNGDGDFDSTAMAKYWAIAAVGVAERDFGALDLVLAGLALHLQRGLGEADHARTRRSGSLESTPPDGFTGNEPVISVAPLSTIFQPSPGPAMSWPSSHIGSYQLNGT